MRIYSVGLLIRTRFILGGASLPVQHCFAFQQKVSLFLGSARSAKPSANEDTRQCLPTIWKDSESGQRTLKITGKMLFLHKNLLKGKGNKALDHERNLRIIVSAL